MSCVLKIEIAKSRRQMRKSLTLPLGAEKRYDWLGLNDAASVTVLKTFHSPPKKSNEMNK